MSTKMKTELFAWLCNITTDRKCAYDYLEMRGTQTHDHEIEILLILQK